MRPPQAKLIQLIQNLMHKDRFKEQFLACIDNRENPFHPLVWIRGETTFGRNVFISGFSEVWAKGAEVIIGDNYNIASFVSINVADSYKQTIGLTDDVERLPITIENNVFTGCHSVVKGGARIGHHSVVAAGTVVDGVEIPPYSLIFGNSMQMRLRYYQHRGLSK